MQNLIFYVSAASTLGVAKDSLGVKNVALPTIIRGSEVCLKMRLFAGWRRHAASARRTHPLHRVGVGDGFGLR